MFSADDRGVAPAVFGAEVLEEDELDANPEPAETTPPQPPEQAFAVPAEAATPPQSEVTVQFAHTPDDELAMLAFSTPERLAACLGDEQPWIAIPKSELQPVQHACEADILETDPVLPAASSLLSCRSSDCTGTLGHLHPCAARRAPTVECVVNQACRSVRTACSLRIFPYGDY